MEPRIRGHQGSKPVLEVDFVEGKDFFIELVRAKGSRLVLAGYEGDVVNCTLSIQMNAPEAVFLPAEEDEFSRHIRFPQGLRTYGSVHQLIQDVESFLEMPRS